MALEAFITRALSFCRDFASDVIDEVRWTDAKLLELIQAANADVHEQLAASADPRSPFGWVQLPFTLTAEQAEYAYPSNLRRFRRLLQYDSDGYAGQEYMLTSPDNDYPGIILLDRRRGFRVRPEPTETETDWYLEFEAQASPYLAFGAVESTGSSTTAVVWKSTDSTGGPLILVDDYYVGQYLTVMKLAAASEKRETRLITDWDATTKTWTVTPALSATPAEDDTWEIAPCLDPPEDHAIFWRVVMTMKLAAGDAAGYAAAENAYRACLSQAMRTNFDVNGQLGPAIAFEQADPLGQESYGINA